MFASATRRAIAPALTSALGLACLLTPAFAQPPANDQCATATVITHLHFLDNTTNLFTATDDPPTTCSGPIPTTSHGVWYRYTSPKNQLVRLHRHAVNFDAVLAVYTGSCGVLTELVCDINEVQFSATTGTTYLFLVGLLGGLSSLPNPSFPDLSVTEIVAPDNDDCQNAQIIRAGRNGYATLGASPSTGAACGPFGADVWFRFIPMRSGRMTLSTCTPVPPDPFMPNDTIIAVYDGCGGTGQSATLLACSDNDCGVQSTLSMEVRAGVEYLIRAGGTPGIEVEAELRIDIDHFVCVNPPANMIAWWAFDEAFGSTAYDTANSNNGAWQGNSPTPSAGRVSGALCFDHPSEFVAASGPGAHDPTNCTIDAWIKPSVLPNAGDTAVICQQSSLFYGLFLTSTGELFAVTQACCLSRVYTSVGAAIQPNVWTHVAFVANSVTDTATFYKNGANVGFPAPYLENSYPAAVPNSWNIGGQSNQFFNGCIDEVEVFTRALAASEINTIYAAGGAGKCKPCAPVAPPACITLPDCPLATENVLQGGCVGNNAAVPGPQLAPLCLNSKGWHDQTVNRTFCHTFTPVPGNIYDAALEIHLRGGNELTCDDTISLQVQGAGFVWTRRIGTGGQICAPFPPGLLGSAWLPTSDNTFCINLGALPNADGSFTNLIPYLNTQQRLDISVQDDTTVESARLWLEMCPPCAPPPPGMVVWLPLDETTPSVAHEIARGHNGAWGPPTTPVTGQVGGGMDFIRTGNSATIGEVVSIPHHADFDFAAGDFSLDAWVYWHPPVTPNTGRTLMSKDDDWRVMLGPSSLSQHIHLGGGFGNPYFCGSPGWPDQTWTHLAITVNQDYGANTLEIRYYRNGVQICQRNANTTYPLNSPKGIKIGGTLTNPYEPGLVDGIVDEVEVFNRVLTAQEVAGIYAGWHKGKCKNKCYAPWETPICINRTSVVVNVLVCNCASSPQTFFVALNPASGFACTGPSPSVFTFLSSNTVTVAGNTCVSIPVRIDRPAGLLPGQHSCYQMCVTNIATGDTGCCSGSLLASNLWCPIIICCDQPVTAITGRPTPVSFGVTNTSAAAATLRYQIAVRHSNMGGPAAAVSLNGLPPGEPVLGTLSVAPGQQVALPASVRFLEHTPFDLYDILLYVDLDNDGTVEPDEELISMALRSALPPACIPDFNNSGIVSVQDIFDFLEAYFSGDPRADINNSGTISVQDIFDFLGLYFAGCP